MSQHSLSIRRSIADASLTPGDRLPPARQLAKELGVNVHTVLKAYQQLQERAFSRYAAAEV